MVDEWTGHVGGPAGGVLLLSPLPVQGEQLGLDQIAERSFRTSFKPG